MAEGGAPRKVGIGAAGIAAIVGGAAALAGGAAAVASGGKSEESAATIDFISSTPAPGGTVTLSRTQGTFPLQVTVAVKAAASYPGAGVGIHLYRGSSRCAGMDGVITGPVALTAGETATVALPGTRVVRPEVGGAGSCFTTEPGSHSIVATT